MGFGGMAFCGSSRFHVVNDGASLQGQHQGWRLGCKVFAAGLERFWNQRHTAGSQQFA